jgi:hypothetical protein
MEQDFFSELLDFVSNKSKRKSQNQSERLRWVLLTMKIKNFNLNWKPEKNRLSACMFAYQAASIINAKKNYRLITRKAKKNSKLPNNLHNRMMLGISNEFVQKYVKMIAK